MRLDAFLVERGLVPTRAAAQRAIDQGRVTVDGRRRPKSHRVGPGEQVELGPEPDAPEPPAAEVAFGVAYEDDHLLVVDKPAGVVVHPGAGNEHGTLAQALAGRAAGGPDPDRPGIVHRLDRDTSGLLVVAKSDAAHAELSRMIRDREVTRRYLALVDGRPPAASGTIDAPLGRDRRRRTVMSSDTDKPREAVTHFETGGGAPADHAAGRGARDGAHAPDPRAHARDRPPGLRRPSLRRRRGRRAAGPGAPVPARARAHVSASGDAGKTQVRVQTTRRSASSTRRSQAGASVRRARRALISRRGGSSRGPPRFRSGVCHGAVRRRSVQRAVRPLAASYPLRTNQLPRRASHGSCPGISPGPCRDRTAGGHPRAPQPKERFSWLRYRSGSCWRPGCTSATRRAAGTRRCAGSSSASAAASTSSTFRRPRSCSGAPRSSPARSRAAAEQCCSWAPRSRPATPSRKRQRRAACPTSTSAGWAGC